MSDQTMLSAKCSGSSVCWAPCPVSLSQPLNPDLNSVNICKFQSFSPILQIKHQGKICAHCLNCQQSLSVSELDFPPLIFLAEGFYCTKCVQKPKSKTFYTTYHRLISLSTKASEDYEVILFQGNSFYSVLFTRQGKSFTIQRFRSRLS